jgi:uncharacterized protein (TIGR00730 family)
VHVFKSVAERCGELIGINGYDMVYGGSSRGMMGVTARAAARNGAKVIGVFPTPLSPEDQALYYAESSPPSGPVKYETLNKNMDEAFFVKNMFERKERMFSISDVFITLPGGMGTIDEFFEVFTTRSLGWHSKEIIIVNTDGYWNQLIKLIENTIELRFASKSCQNLFRIVATPDEAFEYV